MKTEIYPIVSFRTLEEIEDAFLFCRGWRKTGLKVDGEFTWIDSSGSEQIKNQAITIEKNRSPF